MNLDLFIKKVPQVVKELISREAELNRRSLNQETIALLEEALVQRVGSVERRRRHVQTVLEDYAAATPAGDARPLADHLPMPGALQGGTT